MSQSGVLPPGIEAGSLGKRFVSYLIDALVPAIVGGVAGGVLAVRPDQDPTVLLVMLIAVGIVILGWAVLCWWMLAAKGATPGMKSVKLQFVGLRDGKPVGWGRAFLRQLVLGLLAATTVGVIVLIITIVTNVRSQGLHDQAAKGVVIKERARHTKAAGTSSVAQAGPTAHAPSGAAPVGLPDHLKPHAGFAAQGQDWSGFAPPAQQGHPPTQAYAQGQVPQQHQPPQSTQPFYQGQTFQPAPQQLPQQPPSFQPTPPGTGAAPQVQNPPPPQPPSPPQSWPRPADVHAEPWGGSTQDHAASWTPPANTAAPITQVPTFEGGQPSSGSAPSAAEQVDSAADPLAAVSASTHGTPDESDFPDDGTRIIPRAGMRAPDEGWKIALEDGRTIDVTGLVLIGRNPQPREGEEDAELIAVGEAARTVSKTHLAVDIDSRGIYVTDRGSTNGSAIANANGEFEPCQPGEIVRVREGQVVTFGEHRLEVQRSYL